MKDPTAQDLLWEYAQRRREVDAEFSADLEAALLKAGFRRFTYGALVKFKKRKRGRTNRVGQIKNRPGPRARLVYVVWPDGWAGHVHVNELDVVVY